MGKGKRMQLYASIISQLPVLVALTVLYWFEPITVRLAEDPKLDLTPDDVSWLIAITQVGCLLGSLPAGELANRIGRKYVIMSIGPFSLVGYIIILFYKEFFPLILSRIIHGLAGGVAFAAAPIYIAEIAEPKLRGRLSGIFQMTRSLGILYAFCFGPYLSYDDFVYACLPAPILSSILLMFMPETPYYLLMSGKEEQAKKVLQQFRDGDDTIELEEMKKAIEEETSRKNSWKILFTDKAERRAFLIVQIVCFTRYLNGYAVLVNYTSDVFSRSESFLSADGMSILLVAILCLMAVVAASVSDWIGRKPLILLSCFGCFFSHLLSAAYYYIHEKTTIDSSNYIWALYIGLFAFCIFSELGLGPMLITLQSEMFGAGTRGLAGGFTEFTASIWCFAVLKSYIPVTETYGVYVTFLFYSFVALVGGTILFWLLKETKGTVIGKTGD